MTCSLKTCPSSVVLKSKIHWSKVLSKLYKPRIFCKSVTEISAFIKLQKTLRKKNLHSPKSNLNAHQNTSQDYKDCCETNCTYAVDKSWDTENIRENSGPHDTLGACSKSLGHPLNHNQTPSWRKCHCCTRAGFKDNPLIPSNQNTD